MAVTVVMSLLTTHNCAYSYGADICNTGLFKGHFVYNSVIVLRNDWGPKIVANIPITEPFDSF